MTPVPRWMRPALAIPGGLDIAVGELDGAVAGESCAGGIVNEHPAARSDADRAGVVDDAPEARVGAVRNCQVASVGDAKEIDVLVPDHDLPGPPRAQMLPDHGDGARAAASQYTFVPSSAWMTPSAELVTLEWAIPNVPVPGLEGAAVEHGAGIPHLWSQPLVVLASIRLLVPPTRVTVEKPERVPAPLMVWPPMVRSPSPFNLL